MARIPDDTRAAIEDQIRADMDTEAGASCRGIASQYSVSPDSVRRIAAEAEIEQPFARAKTQNATRARTTDMAARRAALAEGLLDDAVKLRERAWSEYEYYERSPDGPVRVRLDLPPLGEARNAYTAVGIAVDKHLVLVKHDTGTGADQARSMLGALAEGLGAAYRAMQADDDGASA